MIDLKRLMFDKSLSQRELAQIIGTTQSEISHFANGRRDLKGQYLQSLIAYFGQETIDEYTIPDRPVLGIPTDAEVTILSPDTVEEMRQEIKEEIEAEEIKKTIVLPEGNEERVLRAANYVLSLDAVDIILLGEEKHIRRRAENINLSFISKAKILSMENEDLKKKLEKEGYPL